ncbi:hypothetical protein BDA99DRAFT_519707, partial [Phascolomyces articulosus]
MKLLGILHLVFFFIFLLVFSRCSFLSGTVKLKCRFLLWFISFPCSVFTTVHLHILSLCMISPPSSFLVLCV